ncbi:uncharacterized protein LAESUDRAFT_811682 [Laetiporus sulphureus 93-53]|uniref:Nucleotidyltransferase n=1 Tax=Laetiporus sulphureus 93-53 TaxID=1314785 RepID=A0A165F2A6_9APHY|nr:uncharacterized protein LAESUDRAFT_811682 [Laetiporus sulphureus 93-53]KZT08223.1 hypothetical protein LAESUDRAFT_811682 [Laetiporus sulphureus 93-53]
MSPPATEKVLREIAQQAVAIFADHGHDCCLFGSLGCALYGTTRSPSDVDLIVLTDEDAEKLKEILVDEDSSFYLKSSDNDLVRWKILWYTLPSARRDCKVDILTPGGKLNLPRVPNRHIKHKRQLPVMQILPLLLTKLRGWTDHRKSRRSDKWRKLHNDVKDIDDLLPIACRTGTHINSRRLRWLRKGFVDFVAASQRRIYKYVEEYPDSAGYWERLGFDAYSDECKCPICSRCH